MPLASDDLERIYRGLRLVRRVEEEVARAYPHDRIKSPVHLSIGQEAVAVGVCDTLHPDDVVSATYRGHAVYLAKGDDLKAFMAELFGKVTGTTGGKGGSMHLIAMDRHVLGASAVVGTTVPVAAGYALALKREGKKRFVSAFFGDGATEEGAFYETLNFAALKALPVLFVCENNQYAIHTPIERRWANLDLCNRVSVFGVPANQVDGADVLAVRRAAAAAGKRIRAGGGPEFIECMTYRWREHVGPNEDYDDGYRTRDELEPWQARDAVVRCGTMIDDDARVRIDAEIEEMIADAMAFAESSPFPSEEALTSHVFAS